VGDGSRLVGKIAPLVLVLLLLAGCGGGDKKPKATATATRAATLAAEQPSGEAEQAVKAMFDDYRAALLARDWGRACSHLAPETTLKLQANLKQLGIAEPKGGCRGLMGLLYDTIDRDPSLKRMADEIAKTATVEHVKISGEHAQVSWSAKVNGAVQRVTQSARIIDGEWKLIDVN
jgi:outer membrane murein-binding lipoprotein Lpp